MIATKTCPFLEWRDARCGSRLTLGGIRDAFRLCAGDPLSCPVHHEIRREQLLRDTRTSLARSA